MSEIRTVNVRFPFLIPTLVIIFVIAKLAGHFDYSWWWVFSPMWIPAAAILGAYLVYCVLWSVVFGIVCLVLLITEGPQYFSKENRVQRKKKKEARKALEDYANALRRNRG